VDKISVLVVEDDKAIRSLIATNLSASHSYTVITADTGKSAILQIASNSPDIVILDLGLPDIDGMDVIQKVRTWSNHPIIVVSARTEDKDKINALDAGADDYLTKPFNMEELQARIRVAIRKMRYDNLPIKDNAVFENGGLKIDYSATFVSVEGVEVHLTPIEYKLLCLLANSVGKVLTYNYILKEIWPHPADMNPSLIRVFMATLRKKIEKDTSNPDFIQTHIGIGYLMNRIAK
jgi:two-component system, OmpR family, KDP operon response regulator KdpE